MARRSVSSVTVVVVGEVSCGVGAETSLEEGDVDGNGDGGGGIVSSQGNRSRSNGPNRGRSNNAETAW